MDIGGSPINKFNTDGLDRTGILPGATTQLTGSEIGNLSGGLGLGENTNFKIGDLNAMGEDKGGMFGDGGILGSGIGAGDAIGIGLKLWQDNKANDRADAINKYQADVNRTPYNNSIRRNESVHRSMYGDKKYEDQYEQYKPKEIEAYKPA